MANYSSNFTGRTWPETGVAFPAGYSYTDDVPPIEEYDDFLTYNTIEDLKHLVELTNERLESSRGTVRPSSPEDGELFWDSDDGTMEVYDAAFGGWKAFSFASGVTNHINSTANPHGVTAAQVGAIEDVAGSVDESHLSFPVATQSRLDAHKAAFGNPHNVTAVQVGASPVGHNHDTRYWTRSASDQRYYTKSQADAQFRFNTESGNLVGNRDNTYTVTFSNVYRHDSVHVSVDGIDKSRPNDAWTCWIEQYNTDGSGGVVGFDFHVTGTIGYDLDIRWYAMGVVK